jgi:transposase
MYDSVIPSLWPPHHVSQGTNLQPALTLPAAILFLLCQLSTGIEELADDLLSSNEAIRRLPCIPEIGSILASTILTEAGDPRAFSSFVVPEIK